jgi:hypothetical protein
MVSLCSVPTSASSPADGTHGHVTIVAGCQGERHVVIIKWDCTGTIAISDTANPVMTPHPRSRTRRLHLDVALTWSKRHRQRRGRRRRESLRQCRQCTPFRATLHQNSPLPPFRVRVAPETLERVWRFQLPSPTSSLTGNPSTTFTPRSQRQTDHGASLILQHTRTRTRTHTLTRTLTPHTQHDRKVTATYKKLGCRIRCSPSHPNPHSTLVVPSRGLDKHHTRTTKETT